MILEKAEDHAPRYTSQSMPSFDVEKEQINVFDFGDTYLFKQYFDQDPLFNKLEKYYNQERYRFEVPDEKLPDVTEVLEEFFYKPEIVHRPDEYCVATEKTVPEDILRSAVHTQRHSKYEVFVMKDELSVRQAVEHGAKSGEKAGIEPGEIEWEIQ